MLQANPFYTTLLHKPHRRSSHNVCDVVDKFMCQGHNELKADLFNIGSKFSKAQLRKSNLLTIVQIDSYRYLHCPGENVEYYRKPQLMILSQLNSRDIIFKARFLFTHIERHKRVIESTVLSNELLDADCHIRQTSGGMWKLPGMKTRAYSYQVLRFYSEQIDLLPKPRSELHWCLSHQRISSSGRKGSGNIAKSQTENLLGFETQCCGMARALLWNIGTLSTPGPIPSRL